MMRLICAFFLACLFVSPILADYQPPEYPKSEDAVRSVQLVCPTEWRGGETVKVSLKVTAEKPIASPRVFVHVARDGKAYHVEAFDAVGKLEAGRTSEFGPFDVHVPAELPGGAYEVFGGVYLSRAQAKTAITLAGPQDLPEPLIINTGTFVDKFDTPHRWHVCKAHTLYWDGQPFIPIGGMHIPDENFESFKAQIDLLAKNNVRDIYFNVGHSIQMPHTWETKSDDKLRFFQKCIDYMDETGMRYGMELSGLQAHGYAYDIMGGRELAVIMRPGETEVRLENSNDDQWLKDGKVHISYRKVHTAYYLLTNAATGIVIASGAAEIVHDDRKNKEGRDRGEEDQIARIPLPTGQGGSPKLEPGEYKLYMTAAVYRDGWNMNMHYWDDDTAKYYQSIRDLYSKIRMGPGFRFFVDAFWNENNFNHGVVPSEETFRTRHAAYLRKRYGTIDKLHSAWKVESADAIADFETAGNCVPLRGIKEIATDVTWDYLMDVRTKKIVRVRQATSQLRYDLLESIGKQVRDFHIEIADLLKGMHEVPVIFKFFSGVDLWHINDAGIAGGHDGIGMETYGLGEPQLAFMAIGAFSGCRQSTKTMWLLVTEVGEGNHQDQALARNKLFGCTSRLGTMYPMYASLLAGGAKGIYHYYMVPSPGADRFWEDSTLRDPRQLEWMGTFARMVENAGRRLAPYAPTVYYRFPAIFHANSGLLYSDPFRDYFNTDCLWWVDPAGKLPNGAWMLPTFTLDVPTDMMFINLENAPATVRWADEVNTFLGGGRPAARITWLGYRKDLGTIPAIDRYYTPEFATADDGIEIQVLKPTPDCRVIAANKDGKVWNLMVGKLQIISKNAENKTGWRPDRVELDGRNHRFDYNVFMRDTLGVEFIPADVEAFTFKDGDQRVTVVAMPPESEKTVQIGKDLPVWGLDATGNVLAVDSVGETSIRIAHIADGTTATYAGGQSIAIPDAGEMDLPLHPDKLVLTKSEGKPAWAREGLVFNTLDSRAAAIFRSPVAAESMRINAVPPAPSGPRSPILIEAEKSNTSNFNLDTFSGLGGLSNASMLGLATQLTPPAPDGYCATWSFDAKTSGTHMLRVRESYLATASPGRWRIDDGPWQEAVNSYLPEDIRIVAQYNSLDDERMVFAWYTYGTCELTAGTHRLTYSVVAKRPSGLDIGLQNSTPYAKLLDCFELVPVDAQPASSASSSSPRVRINLLTNPSLEQDVGGWTAHEWTGDRWKFFELRDEQGWNREFWWTKKVGGEGRFFIDGMMDLGGMTVRQSFVGVRALRLRAGEKPRRFSAEPIAVEPGERIVFGGQMRVETLHASAEIRLRWLDADGRELSTASASARSGDTHWEPHSQTATAPTAARLAVLDCLMHETRPSLTRYGRQWQDSAWFDDMFVYRAK